jgi:hypothetical protein
MKKIVFLVILSVSVIFPQTGVKKSFLQLQNETAQIKTSSNKINLLNGEKPEKKNPGLAVCFSLLLPGMGELYAGSFESGKYFLISDVVLWGTVIGMNSYGSWKRDNYKSFAQTYGGINPDSKDEDYFANLGDYNSIDDYNREMDLQREFGKVYNVQKYYWNWNGDSRRKEYRDMWRSSEQAFTNIRFVVGALILNRLISVINAVRLVSVHNKNVDQVNSVDLSFSPNYLENVPVGLSLNVRASF